MATHPASSDSCPECERPLLPDGSCLHCAMELALAAATESPAAAEELPAVAQGFAIFADPVLPMEVGRFRLLVRLGMGGMGTVYEAEDRILGRTIAFKMIRGFRCSTVEEMNRFHREGRAAARLDHPNIVPIYEIGTLEGFPFMALKLIRGTTLVDRLRGPRMLVEEAARVMLKVASAVHHAHGQGVLHRDLKPSNILLDETGEPWLTDFGMAWLEGSGAGLTVTGAQIGTPQYMSPEQAAGQVRGLTTASDVWALGAIFYQMLSGVPPYEGESHLAIIHAVVTTPPPQWSPAGRREKDLAVLLERCLQKDPAARLPGAGTLAAELERWLGGGPVLSRPVSLAELGRRWFCQNARMAGMAALAVLGVAFGLREWRVPPPSAAPGPVAGLVISRQGTELLVRDIAGENDVLTLQESPPGYLEIRTLERTVLMPDGTTSLRMSRPIPLAGLSRIVVDTGAGNDAIEVGGFEGGRFPDLDLRGGTGNDIVIFKGVIHFAPGASLAVDLQREAPDAGEDAVQFDYGSSLYTSGMGAISVKCSGRIWVGAKVELSTVDGGITLEANQQEPPIRGEMKGVEMVSGVIRSMGRGPVTVSGRGGTRGTFQFGISMSKGAVIQGGTNAALRLLGIGVSSLLNDNTGINLEDDNSTITSLGADILLEGRGGGVPECGSNNGIAVVGGNIQGPGRLVIQGKGGVGAGGSNHGVLLRGPGVLVRSGGGDVLVSGRGGGSPPAGFCYGVFMEDQARLEATGAGRVEVDGTGAPLDSGVQTGVELLMGAVIQSAQGTVRIAGQAGNAASAGVRSSGSSIVSGKGEGEKVTILGERPEIPAGTIKMN